MLFSSWNFMPGLLPPPRGVVGRFRFGDWFSLPGSMISIFGGFLGFFVVYGPFMYWFMSAVSTC